MVLQGAIWWCLGSAGLAVVLGDLRGLSQPKQFHDQPCSQRERVAARAGLTC